MQGENKYKLDAMLLELHLLSLLTSKNTRRRRTSRDTMKELSNHLVEQQHAAVKFPMNSKKWKHFASTCLTDDDFADKDDRLNLSDEDWRRFF